MTERNPRRVIKAAVIVLIVLLPYAIAFRDPLFGALTMAGLLALAQPILPLTLLAAVGVTVAVLCRSDERSLLAFRSPRHRAFAWRSLALAVCGLIFGLVEAGAVHLRPSPDCDPLRELCGPMRLEGWHEYRGWPISWVNAGVVDAYDQAQAVIGFVLDLLLWFWIVSVPHALVLLAARAGRWWRRARKRPDSRSGQGGLLAGTDPPETTHTLMGRSPR